MSDLICFNCALPMTQVAELIIVDKRRGADRARLGNLMICPECRVEVIEQAQPAALAVGRDQVRQLINQAVDSSLNHFDIFYYDNGARYVQFLTVKNQNGGNHDPD